MAHFQIERRFTSKIFRLGRILGGKTLTNTNKKYIFKDTFEIVGLNLCHLTQTLFSCLVKYSKMYLDIQPVQTINCTNKNTVSQKKVLQI